MANFNDIKGLTLKWEGGLSKATTDTASRNPSPYVHKGVTGWHTNKGVTYSTFVSASKKLGFENNANNFINMPDAIWNKIAKGLYWDNLNLDQLKSNGVAFQLFSWNWGAGTGWFPRIKRFLTSKGIEWNGKSSTLSDSMNKLIEKQGEKKTIADLDIQQKEYYTSLNQPANIKGWINRIKDTTSYAVSYIGNIYNENKTAFNTSIVLGFVLLGAAYFTYKKNKK
jgi:hypothetical protein